MSVILTWNRYIDYLKLWADIHADPEFAGMSPACFDEWCDCEASEQED